MGAFDNFMIQYQGADLTDINNVLFEIIAEHADYDGVEILVRALFARGYVIVPIKEVGNE
jgi:hypothetical protein